MEGFETNDPISLDAATEQTITFLLKSHIWFCEENLDKLILKKKCLWAKISFDNLPTDIAPIFWLPTTSFYSHINISLWFFEKLLRYLSSFSQISFWNLTILNAEKFRLMLRREKSVDRQRRIFNVVADSAGLTHNCQESISLILSLNHGSLAATSTDYDLNVQGCGYALTCENNEISETSRAEHIESLSPYSQIVTRLPQPLLEWCKIFNGF